MKWDSIVRYFADQVTQTTGIEFNDYKYYKLSAALPEIARLSGHETPEQLHEASTPEIDDDVLQLIYDAVIVKETCFFQHDQVFSFLEARILPEIRKSLAPDETMNVLVVGCSTGQEVLSLSMLFDSLREKGSLGEARILGIDVLRSAIVKASSMTYSQNEIQHKLPIRTITKYFTPDGDSWRPKPGVFERVRYQEANALNGVASGKFDLVLCLNLMNHQSQSYRELLENNVLNYVKAGGHLLLGSDEKLTKKESVEETEHLGGFCYRKNINGH